MPGGLSTTKTSALSGLRRKSDQRIYHWTVLSRRLSRLRRIAFELPTGSYDGLLIRTDCIDMDMPERPQLR
jgi:hypothetical protein